MHGCLWDKLCMGFEQEESKIDIVHLMFENMHISWLKMNNYHTSVCRLKCTNCGLLHHFDGYNSGVFNMGVFSFLWHSEIIFLVQGRSAQDHLTIVLLYLHLDVLCTPITPSCPLCNKMLEKIAYHRNFLIGSRLLGITTLVDRFHWSNHTGITINNTICFNNIVYYSLQYGI